MIQNIKYLLFVKQWTKKDNDALIAQRLLGLSLVTGLLFLFIGCVLSAVYGVDPSAILGERFTR